MYSLTERKERFPYSLANGTIAGTKARIIYLFFPILLVSQLSARFGFNPFPLFIIIRYACVRASEFDITIYILVLVRAFSILSFQSSHYVPLPVFTTYLEKGCQPFPSNTRQASKERRDLLKSEKGKGPKLVMTAMINKNWQSMRLGALRGEWFLIAFVVYIRNAC